MPELTYEKAIARLEQIVASLENEKLGLDDSLKLFEEGTKLVEFCNTALDRTEQKIITLNGGRTDSSAERTEQSEEESHDELPF